jgi:hypothetical protein
MTDTFPVGRLPPQCSLDGEISEAVSVGNRGCDYRTQRPFLILPSGKSHLVEGRQDVVSVLLVSGGDSIFHKELPVAVSIVGRIRVVHDVLGRRGENDLDILGKDDFKTLAHAVVVRDYAAIVGSAIRCRSETPVQAEEWSWQAE